MAENAPRIVPVNAPIMGANITIVADANPGLFPNGLEITIFVPGTLKPLGSGPIPCDHMLAIVPPQIARQIRAEMHKHAQRVAGPGEVRAPGVIQ